MSAFEVLEHYGAARLARFVAALILFLFLHLLRWPLLLLVRVLEVAMRRVDGYATGLTNPLITVRGQPRHAHAP